MKQATLTTIPNGIQTTGRFYCKDFDNVFECDTLELPDLKNAPNISCILESPEGKPYLCMWTYSPRHGRYTYQITAVPERTGIRFDVANFSRELLGCVGLGRGYMPPNEAGEIEILHSKDTNDEFNSFFNKEPFGLTIIRNEVMV